MLDIWRCWLLFPNPRQNTPCILQWQAVSGLSLTGLSHPPYIPRTKYRLSTPMLKETLTAASASPPFFRLGGVLAQRDSQKASVGEHRHLWVERPLPSLHTSKEAFIRSTIPKCTSQRPRILPLQSHHTGYVASIVHKDIYLWEVSWRVRTLGKSSSRWTWCCSLWTIPTSSGA